LNLSFPGTRPQSRRASLQRHGRACRGCTQKGAVQREISHRPLLNPRSEVLCGQVRKKGLFFAIRTSQLSCCPRCICDNDDEIGTSTRMDHNSDGRTSARHATLPRAKPNVEPGPRQCRSLFPSKAGCIKLILLSGQGTRRSYRMGLCFFP
jgi:hypothetical protein